MKIKIKPVPKPKEKDIELQICQWLSYNKFFVFKPKDQTAFRNGSFRRPRPFEIPGVSDLIAIRSGKVFFIEVKTKTGTQSKAQKEFEKNITMHGGVYLLVRSVEDLKYKLTAYL